MIKRICLIVILFCFTVPINAQDKMAFVINDSLKYYGKNILQGKSEQEKSIANQNFLRILNDLLQEPSSFEASFDSVKNMLVQSPDNKAFRIYTWATLNADEAYDYHGFVQVLKKGKVTLYRLTDRSNEVKNPETTTLDHSKWYGALYYKVLTTSHKKDKYYTLLAWDGNDKVTNKKIIEVLTFDKRGFPKFGAPIFNYEKEKKIKKRIILEYNDNAQVSLKWEEERKQIVFNHLSPSESRYNGNFQFYFPDEGNDAFEFKKGKWNFLPEIDIRLNIQ